MVQKNTAAARPIVESPRSLHLTPPSDLPSCQQLRKKVLFYFQKLSSVPVTQLRRKSLQVLRFSHDLIRLFIKKLKKFHKKIIFFNNFTSIILLPLKYPIWIMAKLRQFSHFLQQINKSVSHPFSKIQTRSESSSVRSLSKFP